MRRCRIYPVHLPKAGDFEWEWRSQKCDGRSQKPFRYFHDCMEDARRSGFAVELQEPVGEGAPGRYAVLWPDFAREV